jgi:hypothetical protein
MLIACLSQAHAQRSKKPFLYEKAAAAAHSIYSPVARMAAPRQSCWAHGLSIERSVELIRAELASARPSA